MTGTPVLDIVLGVIFGTLIPLLMARYIPNEKLYNFFFNLGQKTDAGASKYIGDSNWESVEDNIGTSIMSIAQGFNDGLNSDDANS